MRKEIVIGSNNQGKVQEIRAALAMPHVTVFSLKDLGVVADVEESGSTIAENALLKAKAYSALVGDRLVLSDDTGLEIKALHGEPGIHVRRWKGYRMTDDEIIEYTLQRLNSTKKTERGAQFCTSIVVAIPGKETKVFEEVLKGIILEQPKEERTSGFPFDSLFYCEEWGLTLGEVRRLPIREREPLQIYTHRERVLKKVRQWIMAQEQMEHAWGV